MLDLLSACQLATTNDWSESLIRSRLIVHVLLSHLQSVAKISRWISGGGNSFIGNLKGWNRRSFRWNYYQIIWHWITSLNPFVWIKIIGIRSESRVEEQTHSSVKVLLYPGHLEVDLLEPEPGASWKFLLVSTFCSSELCPWSIRASDTTSFYTPEEPRCMMFCSLSCQADGCEEEEEEEP